MKPTGPTNPILKELIKDIRNHGYKEKSRFLIRLAELLEISRRRKIEVTLSKLNRVCKENEVAVVPGKVLDGILNKKITISAFKFSEKALKNIEKTNSKAMTIKELIKENPKGKNVKIVM